MRYVDKSTAMAFGRWKQEGTALFEFEISVLNVKRCG